MQYFRIFYLIRRREYVAMLISKLCEFINQSETGRVGGKVFSEFSLSLLKTISVI